ncbi:hypothetical protein GCM10023169_20880 [Georgenia halophila]|uniref:Uncharacterized protein n=1 Tax=Georgenia halophila TaxID=620889 RepID=A0ABP8L7I0_9MICO
MSALLDRLRSLPRDFAAAYRERETELRAALLPDDDAVTDARAAVAARRAASARHSMYATNEPDDDISAVPY